MVKPITPDEARARKQAQIPDFVIESFNELIAENMTLQGKVTLNQDEVIERIQRKTAADRSTIFAKNWLDVEPLYEAAGWAVEYYKPPYYVTETPTFTFTKPGRG